MIEVISGSILFMLVDNSNQHHGVLVTGRGLRTSSYVSSSYFLFMARSKFLQVDKQMSQTPMVR